MSYLHTAGRRRFGAGAALVIAMAAALVVLSMTAFATAKSATLSATTVHLNGPSGQRTEPIAVNSKGLSVYWLSPETTHHLLCTSSTCLSFWPPVKVSSGAKLKAAGVKGKLGTLHRHGFTQLTLNGHPVYTFAEDKGKRGVAVGDGVKAFGGTWHVFKEGSVKSAANAPAGSSSSTSTTSMSSTTTSSSSSAPGYGPGY
jgi:predicted lipoprotein with Yx(FWY)xxD motif